MHVVLDTNVFVADPWLRSAKFKALFEFLDRSNSSLFLHEVIETELEAVLRRRWGDALEQLRGAHAKLEREGLPVEPVTTRDLEEHLEHWKSTWNERLTRRIVRVPMEGALLQETVRRCANRIPPATRGKEFRDTLLWLGILNEDRHKRDRVGFVSMNTREFATKSGDKIHPRLAEDLKSAQLSLRFFSSLEEFVKSVAEPIAHINWDWVEERLDHSDVDAAIRQLLEDVTLKELEPLWPDEEWEPRGSPRLVEVNWEWNDYWVWETIVRGETDIFLDLAINAVFEIQAERDNYYPDGVPWTDRREFRLDVQYWAALIVVAVDETLSVTDFEDYGIVR